MSHQERRGLVLGPVSCPVWPLHLARNTNTSKVRDEVAENLFDRPMFSV